MDYSAYFDPIALTEGQEASYGSYVMNVMESQVAAECRLVILFVPEFRYTGDSILHRDASAIIDRLIGLFPHSYEPKIGLLGLLKLGESIDDTEMALSEICQDLMQVGALPLVIGGSRELTFACYRSFERNEQVVNITSIDAYLNIQRQETLGYIGRIIKEQPNFLFNYSNLGYQTYHIAPAELSLADELYFDVYRLGELRGNVVMSEPIIRSSEVLSVSMESIKASDFSSTFNPQPNGFYAEEVCQMMRYAGLGEKLKIVVISDSIQSLSQQDDLLIAEMIWCLVDGVYCRRSEIPSGKNESFLEYRVSIKNDEFQLVFYKSLSTDRWWMEVPVPPEYSNRYRKHHLIPCSYEDYKSATQDDLPDRWWKAYKKLL